MRNRSSGAQFTTDCRVDYSGIAAQTEHQPAAATSLPGNRMQGRHSAPASPVSLTLTLNPENVELPGQAILTITDHHTNLESGIWYSISINGETGEISQQISVELLVGG